MADPVVLELLGRGALLVDVVALALAERSVHLPGGDVQRPIATKDSARLADMDVTHYEVVEAFRDVIDGYIAREVLPSFRRVPGALAVNDTLPLARQL